MMACTFICGAYIKICGYDVLSIENFYNTNSYTEGIYIDVTKSDWFHANVAMAYDYELMKGNGEGIFSPSGNVTIAEAITIATRINNIYNYGETLYVDVDEEFSAWYTPYVVYALDSGIIASEYVDYNAPATRAEFAKILANSMDNVEFTEINYVDDGAIPDVPIDSDCAESVYLLYRAGIIAGSDERGTFYPDSTITRAEAAAIITRMIDPSLRRNIELYGEY